MKISRIVEQMAPSGIRAFFDLVLGMKDVISLGVGEPDFETPWNIREKAIYSLEQGLTSYTSNKGMPELRIRINEYQMKKFGISYDEEEEILITVGVSEGLDLAVRAILNHGEKILIHEPCYVSYGPVVELAGGTPVFIPTPQDAHFKITPEQIKKYYTKDCRALMLNYPCNPTGASYTKKELLAIAKVVKELDLIVISDEVYDELTYDFDHTPIASLPGMKNRVIYLNGFSKVYAMTGFRLGWACGPRPLIDAMTKIHQYTMLCASITSQMAAFEALRSGGQREAQKMKKEYHRRRNYIVGALNEIGMPCHTPEGAFYAFPSIENVEEDSLSFAQNLLMKEKVALVPGVAFGKSCEGQVRISYASSYENLQEAIKRIKNYLDNK